MCDDEIDLLITIKIEPGDAASLPRLLEIAPRL